MTEPLLLDTSILIALFQKQSSIQPELLDNYDLNINNYILQEFICWLQENYTKEQAIRARNLLLSHLAIKICTLTPQHQELACKIMEKLKPDFLNFTECLILAHAKLDNLTLASKNPRMQRYKTVKHR